MTKSEYQMLLFLKAMQAAQAKKQKQGAGGSAAKSGLAAGAAKATSGGLKALGSALGFGGGGPLPGGFVSPDIAAGMGAFDVSTVLGAQPGLGVATGWGTPVTSSAASGIPGLSGLGSAALPGLAAIGGAATAYKSIDGVKDLLAGDKMDFGSQLALALPTFGLSFAANPLVEALGSGKDGAQKARDRMRDALNEKTEYQNATPDAINYTLADGSNYSAKDYESEGKTFDLALEDFNANPDGLGQHVGALQALATALLPGIDQNQRVQSTGEHLHAAMSQGEGNIGANIDSFYDDPNFDRNKLYESIAQQWRDGQIDADLRDASFAAIDKQYGIKNESGGRWEDAAGLTPEEIERNKKQLGLV